MRPETSEASAKAGPGVLLGGEPGSYSRNGENHQPAQAILEPVGGALIGCPVVVIDRKESSATVWIANAPWGWGSREVTFLNAGRGGAAERYAGKLLKLLEAAASREAMRRERILAAMADGGAK
jgi:hypothetical protein